MLRQRVQVCPSILGLAEYIFGQRSVGDSYSADDIDLPNGKISELLSIFLWSCGTSYNEGVGGYLESAGINRRRVGSADNEVSLRDGFC